MLVQAAAESWNVPADEITVEKGIVQHKKSGQSSSFGGLVAKAATLPMPKEVKLKDPKDFKLIGQMLPRKDAADKAHGSDAVHAGRADCRTC